MMNNTRKRIAWPCLFAAGCTFVVALVAGRFAWQAADAFLSEITPSAEGLLFKFSLFFGIAVVFLNASLTLVLLWSYPFLLSESPRAREPNITND